MKKLITGLLSCFAVVLLIMPMAHAQTPDGETPAEETVCDGLDDSLFGTCNAYCEAMDCDNPNNDDAKACQVKLKKCATLAGSEPIPCKQAPGLTLSKTVNANEEGLIPIGDDVIYTFTIMNEGNVSLTGIQFDDAILGFSEADCSEFDPSQTLATNASITCTSNPVPAEAGLHTNTASASAETLYGALPVLAPLAEAKYTGATVEAAICPCWTQAQIQSVTEYRSSSDWSCSSSDTRGDITWQDNMGDYSGLIAFTRSDNTTGCNVFSDGYDGYYWPYAEVRIDITRPVLTQCIADITAVCSGS